MNSEAPVERLIVDFSQEQVTEVGVVEVSLLHLEVQVEGPSKAKLNGQRVAGHDLGHRQLICAVCNADAWMNCCSSSVLCSLTSTETVRTINDEVSK